MAPLSSWSDTQPERFSHFVVHVLAQIFTYNLYYVYLAMYKIMMNFGTLNWFDSFIKKLKKALDCIPDVIYTYDIQWGVLKHKTLIDWITSIVKQSWQLWPAPFTHSNRNN